MIKKDDIRQIIRSKEYILQIQKLTNDCPAFQMDVKTITFTEKELVKYVTAYNKCKGGTQYLKAKDTTINTFYLLGGFVQPITRSTYFDVISTGNKGTITPVIGIGYEYGLSRNRNRWSAGAELCYQKLLSEFSYSDSNPIVSPHYLKLDFDYLRLNGHFTYIISTKKIQPYIKFGVGIAVAASSNSGFGYLNSGNRVIQPEIKFSTTEKYLFTAFGLKSNNFFIEGRLELGENVNPDFVILKNLTNHLGLSVGYVFATQVKK